MVLLLLKLFVSSHPFELWRCPMHLCFVTPWGTSWIPLCYVFSMLETNKWLSIHYYSWSFVCVSFHVVTWLLSSMVRIISLMPMFRVLWSQHAMFYFKLMKIVLVHVTSKIIVLLPLTVVTQHTTACCSMQVVDITFVRYHFTNITSLRVVQQKHSDLYSSTKYYKP
jgi:hypothetical protein